ncbi:MAG TPA: methyltransferase [Trueperaceae bacterium]|nr:methyltransferase [Trueperaceae bacterium]
MSDAADHLGLVEAHVAGAGSLLTSPAVRGFPAAAPGLAELLAALPELTGRVADVSGSAGGGALAAGEARVSVLEPSYAAFRAARHRFVGEPRVAVSAGLPWDLDAEAFDVVLALPPGDRGSDRVRAEIEACARALAPGGSAYLAMHKDLGAKRYERFAGEAFAEVEVIARSKGWRVARLRRPQPGGAGGGGGASSLPADAERQPWRRYEALGRSWWALPGVFAARALDAGSAELLTALDELGNASLAGADVLDLGCGTGVLAARVRDAGARSVWALDDDLAAVRSSRRNLAGADARVLHSDLDAALEPDRRFDVVVANPPFHVGKQVRLALSRAFVRAAAARLRPGGELLLVANRALPYERELERWRSFDTLRESAAFKVLRARS